MAGHRRAGGTVAFARAEWRTRGRSHVVVAMLVAITAAVVLATLAAAERSRTAFDRLRDATDASDVAVHISSGNPEPALRELRETPGVVGARAFSQLFLRPEGTDLFPLDDLTAIAPRIDDATSTVDTAIITRGRAPRPDRANEVALSTRLAERLGVDPGDELRLETMTDRWAQAHYDGQDLGPPDGPTLTVTVTGIARSPAEFGFFPSMIHLTPAFVARYDGQLKRLDDIHVRLEPDELELHQRTVRPLLFGSFEEPSFFVDEGATLDGLGTIGTGLRLVGLAAALAGTLAVGLALARMHRASKPDRTTLVALGWTRADGQRALALVHVPALMVGLAAGMVVGVLASPRAAVGLARAIDPQPDSVLVSTRLVLAVGGSALAVAVIVLAAVGVLGTRRSPQRSARAAGIPIGRPLEVVLGLHQAVVAPADSGGRSSRGAIAAMAGATAVAVAALVVSSSIARLQSDPSLTGQGRPRVIDSGDASAIFDQAMPRLDADDRVATLSANYVDLVTMAGPGEVWLLVDDPRRGQIEWSIIDGRMPVSADEIALGPATLDATAAHVGGEVEVSGNAGTDRFRVVGVVLLPEGPIEHHDEGAAVTIDGGTTLLGEVSERALGRHVVFEWADGVDADAADRELEADGFRIESSEDPIKPGTVTNLGEVEQLPRQLAALVGLLAVATLLHVAWTGVRFRARELVTLRALGATRRSIAAITWTHTLAIVAIGVAVGTPLGLATGRGTWRPIAENAHLVVRPVLGWSWLATVLAAAALAGIAVAGLAVHWAGRLRVAAELRAE